MSDAKWPSAEFVKLYRALGIPYPREACKGPCEGTGFIAASPYGTYFWNHITFADKRYWLRQHRLALLKTLGIHAFFCDGYHHVQCWHCVGTGKEPLMKKPMSGQKQHAGLKAISNNRSEASGYNDWPSSEAEAKRRWRRAHWIAVLKTLGIHAFSCDGYHSIGYYLIRRDNTEKESNS